MMLFIRELKGSKFKGRLKVEFKKLSVTLKTHVLQKRFFN